MLVTGRGTNLRWNADVISNLVLEFVRDCVAVRVSALTNQECGPFVTAASKSDKVNIDEYLFLGWEG
ncbi:MAG TPA: hypothetical protein VI756_12785 [Blastocatellia bacterium]